MGGHFKPEPYFSDGIVAAVRCELGETEDGDSVPKTHYIEYRPGGKLFCHGPGVRPNGKPYGGCGRENWDGAMSMFLMTGQKTRCMEVMDAFRRVIAISKSKYGKIPREIRQIIPKDILANAWTDEMNVRYQKRLHFGKPIERMVTPEQIKVETARYRKRLQTKFLFQNQEITRDVSSRCSKAGLFQYSHRAPLEKTGYFRSISLLKIKQVDNDGDYYYPLLRAGMVWDGLKWCRFMPVQVAATLPCHIIIVGFMQTPTAQNSSRLVVAFGNVHQPCLRYDVPVKERPLAENHWAQVKRAKSEVYTVDGIWTFPHVERHLDEPRFIGRLKPFPFALSK